MNVLDEIRNIRNWIGEMNRLLMGVRRGGAGGGEANTASNVGVGGVGLYDAKAGVDLQFRNVNAASNKVTVALDAGNKEVDLDIDPSKIDLDDLGDVDAAAPANNDVLTYELATRVWKPQAGGGGGGAAINPYAFRRTGRCYTTWNHYTSTVQQAINDKFYAYPFIVPVSQSFDKIIVRCSTAAVNGVCHVGIYDDDGVYPDDLILDSGEIDCSATGYKETVIAETLIPGLYWLVLISDGDTVVSFSAMDYNQTSPIGYFSILGHDEDNFIAPPYTHWSLADVYGALPDPFPGGASRINNENLIAIFLRKT